MKAALLIGLIVAICVGLVSALIENEREWDKFKTAHACKVVAHTSGQVYNTISVDTKGRSVIGTATTPDTTSWLCDDGIVYTR